MAVKADHLKMIQALITRMAHNSFLLKGWSVTLTSAILALAVKNPDTKLIFIALLPALMFWGLDGYFLRQERLFRRLYDQVRTCSEEEIDFSMDTRPYQADVAKWFDVVKSPTLLAFHLLLVATISIICFSVLYF